MVFCFFLLCFPLLLYYFFPTSLSETSVTFLHHVVLFLSPLSPRVPFFFPNVIIFRAKPRQSHPRFFTLMSVPVTIYRFMCVSLFLTWVLGQRLFGRKVYPLSLCNWFSFVPPTFGGFLFLSIWPPSSSTGPRDSHIPASFCKLFCKSFLFFHLLCFPISISPLVIATLYPQATFFKPPFSLVGHP